MRKFEEGFRRKEGEITKGKIKREKFEILATITIKAAVSLNL